MQDLIEIETGAPVSAVVIWLHGLGADGNDFVPVIPALPLPEIGIRFLFPHAPVRAVTINGGMAMRAWYDILAMGAERHINEDHLLDAADQIEQLLQREVARGIARQRIFLVGFSQGGAVAYHCGLRGAGPLGGVALLSTYRVNPMRFPCVAGNRATPLFCAHGEFDDVVPLPLGQQGVHSVTAEGMLPEWQRYPMGHEVCQAEIEALGDWLTRHLTRAIPVP